MCVFFYDSICLCLYGQHLVCEVKNLRLPSHLQKVTVIVIVSKFS